jgi:ABC-type branched-subunit amino acid transport system ATPase component
MSLLELRDVHAGYGSIKILHGVSLHVNASEIVSVIGPNGAGKSTTFKVIMNLITRALEISGRGYVLELGRKRFEGKVRRMYLGGAARPA